MENFDLWFTGKLNLAAKDITCDLCIWTWVNQMEPDYLGRHETIKIGGRTCIAIIANACRSGQRSAYWKGKTIVKKFDLTAGSGVDSGYRLAGIDRY